LVLDLSMGTLFQSASAANAPQAAVRSADMAATETPAPQIIEWNNSSSGGGVSAAPLALGGGYGGGPSTAKSVMAVPGLPTEAAGVPTETAGVSTDTTQLMATPPAPSAGTPAPGETSAPTAAPSFSAQSENNGAVNGPILGVPPTGQQGKIIVTAAPTSAPESVVTEVFPFRRVLELALALLAVGMALAAWFVRRQR
jgi:hypothetical protein